MEKNGDGPLTKENPPIFLSRKKMLLLNTTKGSIFWEKSEFVSYWISIQYGLFLLLIWEKEESHWKGWKKKNQTLRDTGQKWSLKNRNSNSENEKKKIQFRIQISAVLSLSLSTSSLSYFSVRKLFETSAARRRASSWTRRTWWRWPAAPCPSLPPSYSSSSTRGALGSVLCHRDPKNIQVGTLRHK